ncbi:MAG: sugar ABC transporter permease [Anaerolineae bacterium]|nr:sugar ABC transporter permease [Anaerolineae bacterium]MDW8101138.1 sugar ABC transporter permease [Anaerolineae bacterium]
MSVMGIRIERGHRERRWRELALGIAFISPAIIGFLAFTIYPVLMALYYSFTDYNILQPPLWIGLDNYRDLITRDKTFKIAIWNTLYMVVIGLPIHLVFDFLMAMLLNVKIRGRSLYRTIFYMPSITPIVATAILWLWIYNPQYGLANSVLQALGLPTIGWIADPFWSKPSLIFMGMWYGGNTILIYLAGLREVPAELLEAAELDGANAVRRTWHVTLPMVSPVIFYTLIINMIGYFQYFTEAWVMTAQRSGAAGGPLNSMMFYTMYLYQNAFQFFKMGYASAMAWILFLIVLVATVVLFRTSGWVYYRSE